jgi:phenylpropionate dioxygenase-like ring-hydroxylating dioxygenase large terminal subunit
MFVSDTHLPQLLPPEAYYDRAWHERELDRVLRPAWWAVALVEELPRDGDFITFDHVDGPVILRRSGGHIHGYRNVCAHRLAKLTGKTRGHCDVLRCEYHGWEYAESGATQRIPDAPSFRPLEKGQLGLGTLRVETVGAIVFLTFDPAAPSVREWLGADAALIEDRFDAATRMVWRADYDLPFNWKLLVENNLESYHVGTVHAATLGASPAEQTCTHELAAGRSRFEAPGDPTWWGGVKRLLARSIGRPANGRYVHGHVHPSFMWVETDLGVGCQSVVPTGPTSCRVSFRSLAWQSRRPRPIADACARAMVRSSLRVWQRIIAEDVAILPQVQAGVESPRHPGPGLISRREERITHFQAWLLERMGLDRAPTEEPLKAHTEDAA